MTAEEYEDALGAINHVVHGLDDENVDRIWDKMNDILSDYEEDLEKLIDDE